MNHVHDFLVSARNRFRAQKDLADRAIAQVSDEELRHALSTETNSIAVIMKHLAGNMRSRWTDFLWSDGEKEDRNRDGEFVDEFPTRAELTADWESGWERCFATLASLTADDLTRTVLIRGASLSVYDAILRQLDHYGYHIGQIVMVARIVIGDGPWQTLSIARGKSKEFNTKTWQK